MEKIKEESWVLTGSELEAVRKDAVIQFQQSLMLFMAQEQQKATLLNRSEAANRLKVSKETIVNRIKDGKEEANYFFKDSDRKWKITEYNLIKLISKKESLGQVAPQNQ